MKIIAKICNDPSNVSRLEVLGFEDVTEEMIGVEVLSCSGISEEMIEKMILEMFNDFGGFTEEEILDLCQNF